MVALSTADMISNDSSNIETLFTLSSLSFHRGKLQFEVYCNHLIEWSYRGFIKSNCDDIMRSMLKMRELLHALFASKIFSLPIPTRPGTRTFLQVPDPSHPEVKKTYPPGPGHHHHHRAHASKVASRWLGIIRMSVRHNWSTDGYRNTRLHCKRIVLNS